MAHISETYDDNRILAELLKVRPEINLGDRVQVEHVDADAGPHNGRPSIKVTLKFPLDAQEWRAALDGSRVSRG